MTKEQKAVIIGMWRQGADMFQVCYALRYFLPCEIQFVIDNYSE